MATYNGYNTKVRRVTMHNVTEEQKVSMEANKFYNHFRFDLIPGSDISPVGVDKKVKPEPAPEPQQEGADKAQPKGKPGE